MKDMFDECELGNLKLKSRIIRTGIWERDFGTDLIRSVMIVVILKDKIA